jgi:hypothetical protein
LAESFWKEDSRCPAFCAITGQPILTSDRIAAVLADTLPETAPGGSAAPGSSGRARRLQGSDGRRFARAVFGERVGLAQLAGIAAAVAGFMMFSKDAMTAAPNREAAWVGDLMFVATAVMWATFGALSKHWRAETSRRRRRPEAK